MELLDGRAVTESLASYIRDRLVESDFFSDLYAGEVPPGHVRDVFGQYYRWRTSLHRWFGICLAKIATADNEPKVTGGLSGLIECLPREVDGNRNDRVMSLLAALGIDDPARIVTLPVTDAYAESFVRCYFPRDRSGAEALAALAGRELAVPDRNKIIVSALSRHYGVTSGLEFFGPHAGFQAQHFQALWQVFCRGSAADSRKLIEAARLEIWEHITFWDDVYSAVAAADSPPVPTR